MSGTPSVFERELLAAARSAIVVCRADRIITYVTPYAARLLGSEPLGQDLAVLVSPREADALISYLARLAGADPDRSFFQESRVATDGERIVEVVGTNRLARIRIRSPRKKLGAIHRQSG